MKTESSLSRGRIGDLLYVTPSIPQARERGVPPDLESTMTERHGIKRGTLMRSNAVTDT